LIKNMQEKKQKTISIDNVWVFNILF
jgi:hypothetical protein